MTEGTKKKRTEGLHNNSLPAVGREEESNQAVSHNI